MLQALLKQQRSKVEEIKKKTNYYSTRELLQRYDEPPSSPSLRLRVAPASTQPSTPQRQPASPSTNPVQSPNILNPQPARTLFIGKVNILVNLTTPLSEPPSGPPRKLWFDKLADALLGDDDQAPNAAALRYALICEKCFAHNGLVKESMWEDARKSAVYLLSVLNYYLTYCRISMSQV